MSICEEIEIKKPYFNHKFYRHHTVVEGEDFIKDLSKIGRPIEKTLIVDNLAVNFRSQKENGILIKPFYGKPDKALYNLCAILLRIALDNSITDIRDGIKKHKEDIISKVTSNFDWIK